MEYKSERRPVVGTGAHDTTYQQHQPNAAANGAQAVRITIGTHVECDSRDVRTDLLRDWIASVTIPNPRHAEAVRAGRYTTEPRELTGAERAGPIVRLPRGTLHAYRQLALQHGVSLAYDDLRASGISIGVTHQRELRAHQAPAVAELVRRQQAVVVAPAGAGKTTIAAGTIAALGCSTLILVGTVDLAEQWRGEIRTQLGVEPGLIGAGKHDAQPITVAIVASLAALDDAALSELLARFGAIIIDECHHAASPTWSRVISASPSKYRMGLTATPHRTDELTALLEWVIGPWIETSDHAGLIDAGHLVAARIERLETSYRYPYHGPDDWAPMLGDIVTDRERNRQIVDHVGAAARAGHSVLVLTGRVDHAEVLAAELVAVGVSAGALHGQKSKKQRAELLGRAKSGDLSVLVATQLADEGLDLPRLSRLYLTYPARAAGRIEQRLGRVMRPHPGKIDAALIDVVDVNVGVLKWQARQRAAVFANVLGGSSKAVSA